MKQVVVFAAVGEAVTGLTLLIAPSLCESTVARSTVGWRRNTSGAGNWHRNDRSGSSLLASHTAELLHRPSGQWLSRLLSVGSKFASRDDHA
jgi:hypothetical protein